MNPLVLVFIAGAALLIIWRVARNWSGGDTTRADDRYSPTYGTGSDGGYDHMEQQHSHDHVSHGASDGWDSPGDGPAESGGDSGGGNGGSDSGGSDGGGGDGDGGSD
jgi:hypothetical protein